MASASRTASPVIPAAHLATTSALNLSSHQRAVTLVTEQPGAATVRPVAIRSETRSRAAVFFLVFVYARHACQGADEHSRHCLPPSRLFARRPRAHRFCYAALNRGELSMRDGDHTERPDLKWRVRLAPRVLGRCGAYKTDEMARSGGCGSAALCKRLCEGDLRVCRLVDR